MQIFYITFCWNRRLFFDGYIMRDDDQKILGCTDEFIIVGDKTGFREIKEKIFIYPISADWFSKNLRVKKEQLKIVLKKENKMTEKQVIQRVNKILKTYPTKTQKEIIGYIKEE